MKTNRIKKAFSVASKFVLDNKVLFLQASLMLTQIAVCSASSVSTGLPIDHGLTTLSNAFTGAIPKTAVTVAAASGCLGYAMDFDQQPMMKKGAKVVCFGSCAVAAPSVTSALMDFTSTSGCLLL